MPEVIEAAQGKAEVLRDGGVCRGTDIIKALALGVKCVGLGKLHGWGLAAGGPAGLVRALQILEEELTVSMGLLGVTNVHEITENHVCKVDPIAPSHEMSAWPNLVGGRLV